MEYLDNYKQYINKDVINYIKNNSLLEYIYIDSNNNNCENKVYDNNCFLKSICDALCALNTFNNIIKDNNNFGKFIKDIQYISLIGGLIPTNEDDNPIYYEDTIYQSNNKIGCMASALTIDSNGQGRQMGDWGEIDQVFIYLFQVLSNIKYQCMDYELSDDDIAEIEPYIGNNITLGQNIFEWKNNDNYNKKMHFIFDKIMNKQFERQFYNNDYFRYCIISEYYNFCYMNYNRNIDFFPILDIDFNDYININKYNDYNIYLKNFIENKYNILYIRKVLIIKLYNYGKNIDFINFNKITYLPKIYNNDNYKLKSVIYSKIKNNILIGGHFVCVREKDNFYYKIKVNNEINEFYANYLFYEKIN